MKKRWSPAREQRLRDMIATGLSPREIANAFGDTTRNAIIGKITRLGLSTPNNPAPKQPKPQQRSVNWARPKKTARRPQSLPPPIDVSAMLEGETETQSNTHHPTLEERRSDQCCWPINDRSPTRFCGQPKILGSSYCATHKKKVSDNKPLKPIGIPNEQRIIYRAANTNEM